jgi:rRNA pseudouridine-1189 N-methylase Emg1 (Nep1/Mra1 family)
MNIPDIESRLPKSFSQLYAIIVKILKENNIMPDEEESKVDQL